MAQINNLVVTGSFLLGTTENTGSAGNMWYDTTENVVKYTGIALTGPSTWAAGGALNVGRSGLSGAGTENAALAAGSNGFSYGICTETYDGTSWTVASNLAYCRFQGGAFGTQNAAAYLGRNNPISTSCTEEFDGSSWSAGGTVPAGGWRLGATVGTQNTGFAFGQGPGTVAVCSYCYNGASWSSNVAMIVTRYGIQGSGTGTAALAMGGYSAGAQCTEEYNGTSWSTGNALPVTRQAGGAAGTQNNTVLSFGRSSTTCDAATYLYDGTSWSTGASGTTVRYNVAAAGGSSANSNLVFGGRGFSNFACTEVYLPGPEIAVCSL